MCGIEMIFWVSCVYEVCSILASNGARWRCVDNQKVLLRLASAFAVSQAQCSGIHVKLVVYTGDNLHVFK